MFYVTDTETTGLEALENDVIEVSYWRFNLSGTVDEQKTWCIKCVNPNTITEKALYINKHKREDILHNTDFGRRTYLEPSDAVDDIESWIADDDVPVQERVFVGQNPMFDHKFLKELWRRTGNENSYPFSRFMLDTTMLVRMIDVCTGTRREKYNLGSLVKSFKVTKCNAHRAADDVRMTKDLFMKIITPLMGVMKENFAPEE